MPPFGFLKSKGSEDYSGKQMSGNNSSSGETATKTTSQQSWLQNKPTSTMISSLLADNQGRPVIMDENTGIRCQMCDVNFRKQAQKSCAECEIHFCDYCLEEYHSRGPYKEHKLIDPNQLSLDASRRCAEHKERYKLLCLSCGELLCALCRDVGKHDGHDLVDIDKGQAMVKGSLMSKLCQLCGIYEDPNIDNQQLCWEPVEFGIRDIKESVQRAEKDYKVKVEKKVQCLYDLVEEIQEYLMEEQQKESKEVEETLSLTTDAVRSNDVYELIQQYTHLYGRLCSLQWRCEYLDYYSFTCNDLLASIKVKVISNRKEFTGEQRRRFQKGFHPQKPNDIPVSVVTEQSQTRAGQPGFVKTGLGQPQSSQTGFTQVGFGQTTSNQHGFGQNGSTDNSLGQIGSNQLGFGQTKSNPPGFGQNLSAPVGFGQSGLAGIGLFQTGPSRSVYGQTGSGPSGFGQTGSGQHGFGQTGSGQSGFGQTGSGQFGLGQSVSGQSGFDQTGSDQPGFGQTMSGQPAFGQTGSGQDWSTFGSTFTGSKHISYKPVEEMDPIIHGQTLVYQNISAMPHYNSKSTEELRHEDYNVNRTHRNISDDKAGQTGTSKGGARTTTLGQASSSSFPPTFTPAPSFQSQSFSGGPQMNCPMQNQIQSGPNQQVPSFGGIPQKSLFPVQQQQSGFSNIPQKPIFGSQNQPGVFGNVQPQPIINSDQQSQGFSLGFGLKPQAAFVSTQTSNFSNPISQSGFGTNQEAAFGNATRNAGFSAAGNVGFGGFGSTAGSGFGFGQSGSKSLFGNAQPQSQGQLPATTQPSSFGEQKPGNLFGAKSQIFSNSNSVGFSGSQTSNNKGFTFGGQPQSQLTTNPNGLFGQASGFHNNEKAKSPPGTSLFGDQSSGFGGSVSNQWNTGLSSNTTKPEVTQQTGLFGSTQLSKPQETGALLPQSNAFTQAPLPPQQGPALFGSCQKQQTGMQTEISQESSDRSFVSGKDQPINSSGLFGQVSQAANNLSQTPCGDLGFSPQQKPQASGLFQAAEKPLFEQTPSTSGFMGASDQQNQSLISAEPRAGFGSTSQQTLGFSVKQPAPGVEAMPQITQSIQGQSQAPCSAANQPTYPANSFPSAQTGTSLLSSACNQHENHASLFGSKPVPQQSAQFSTDHKQKIQSSNRQDTQGPDDKGSKKTQQRNDPEVDKMFQHNTGNLMRLNLGDVPSKSNTGNVIPQFDIQEQNLGAISRTDELYRASRNVLPSDSSSEADTSESSIITQALNKPQLFQLKPSGLCIQIGNDATNVGSFSLGGTTMMRESKVDTSNSQGLTLGPSKVGRNNSFDSVATSSSTSSRIHGKSSGNNSDPPKSQTGFAFGSNQVSSPLLSTKSNVLSDGTSSFTFGGFK